MVIPNIDAIPNGESTILAIKSGESIGNTIYIINNVHSSFSIDDNLFK